MNDRLWLDPDISLRLCLVLLHSLWIVALLAGLARLADRFWPRSVDQRYIVHVAALLAALVALPVTYALVGSEQIAVTSVDTPPVTSATGESTAAAPVVPFAPQSADVAGDGPATTIPAAVSPAAIAPSPAAASGRADWQSAATGVVMLYVLGVFFMLARLVRGLASAQRTVAGASPISSGPVVDTLQELARDWSLRIVPAVAVAQRIVVPQVVGLLRPMILLPASTLSGLTVDELQMILAHELAHVRRHDLWINLVQRLAEVALFFNPALWYLTRRINLLREFCCDELTCGTLPSAEPAPRTRYAAALLRVAELSRPQHAAASELAALAASGRSPSELRRRIAHLFGEPVREPLRLSRGGLVVIVAGIALLLAGPALWHPHELASAEVVAAKDDTPDTDDGKPSDEPGFVTVDISGRALDEQGQPIANARIFAVSLSVERSIKAEITTDADGRYRMERITLPVSKTEFNALPAMATFEMFGFAEGYALAFRPNSVIYPEAKHLKDYPDPFSGASNAPSCFGMEDPIDLDLRFGAPHAIRGRLVDDRGEPIAGAKAVIRMGEIERNGHQAFVFNSANDKGIMPAEFLERVTDADGRFEFTRLPADLIWSISLRPEGYSSRQIYAAGVARGNYYERPVYSGDFELVFPRPHDVTIQVVHDDTGELAPKVLVSGPRETANFNERTDDGGLVHVRLPKGTFEVEAWPRYQTPYFDTSLEVVIGDEPPQQPFVLRLRPAAIAEITVTDADTGNPLPGVDVWVQHPGSNGGDPYRQAPDYRSYEMETNRGHYGPSHSDENGRMRVNFEPGRHVIGIGRDVFPVGYVPVDPEGTEIECALGKVTKVAFQMRRDDPAKAQAAPAAAPAAEVRTYTRRRFKLLVVDPQGQPVPNADVELRIDPAPSNEHVVVGEFVKESEYGPFAKTDADGRLYFSYAAQPRSFNLSIKTPGYGPYWAEWSSEEHPQAIPTEFTAELEAGWSVGGIVVDEQGQPVAGVQVKPSISFKKRPGDEEHLGVGTRIKTDDAGRWRFDSVPESMSEVGVEVSHPNFAPLRRALTRAEFGLEMDQAPTASITLPRGLTIAGHVSDADGNPIEGALLRTKFSNDIREARTDADGNYRLAGCESRMTRLVVSAPGRATDMQVVRIDPGMRPVNFTMQPGGKVRIRVVDEQGQGIPKARTRQCKLPCSVSNSHQGRPDAEQALRRRCPVPNPAGTFLLGEGDRYAPRYGYQDSGIEHERPRHPVTLTRPFCISQFSRV